MINGNLAKEFWQKLILWQHNLLYMENHKSCRKY